MVERLDKLTLETARTEKEAATDFDTALGKEVDLEGERENECEEGGMGIQRALGAL